MIMRADCLGDIPRIKAQVTSTNSKRLKICPADEDDEV
jgi:hypothetical protein